ncbi:MAG: amidohydrolase family protein [Deltaproteobacteria bacterium]|nr:amidohydrolase family protein [Deltaproteobacteria bacterium]
MARSNLSQTLALPLPVDTHVHLSLGGDPQANARLQLAAGVAVVRDAGSRDGLLDGVVLPPALTVVKTGPAIFKKGFYGSFLGDNRALSLAEKIAQTPSSFVKLILTGMVSFDVYGEVGPQQWSFAELCEIVGLAEACGKKVMVHVNSDKACREAVTAGAHSLEHGYFISSETLLMMAEKGVYWTPTVAAMANQTRDPDKRFSAVQLQIIERNYKRHLEMIRFAHEHGVKLTIGTDSGSYNVPHGSSFLREMELFVEAGIPVAEVWRIATANGYELLGLPGELRLNLDPGLPLNTLLEQAKLVFCKQLSI